MNLLSKSAAARHLGVPPYTVTRGLKGPLKAALVGGGRIDVDHPAALEFARAAKERQAEAAAPKAETRPSGKARGAPRARKVKAHSAPPAELPAYLEIEGQPEISELENLTLKRICERYGTLPQFSDHLRAYATLADAGKKELSVHEAKGRLISRELVRSFTMGHLDALHTRLLRDIATSLALQIPALIKSGSEKAELRLFIQDSISKQLKASVAAVVRSLQATFNLEVPPPQPDSEAETA